MFQTNTSRPLNPLNKCIDKMLVVMPPVAPPCTPPTFVTSMGAFPDILASVAEAREILSGGVGARPCDVSLAVTMGDIRTPMRSRWSMTYRATIRMTRTEVIEATDDDSPYAAVDKAMKDFQDRTAPKLRIDRSTSQLPADENGIAELDEQGDRFAARQRPAAFDYMEDRSYGV